jgi:pyrimidine operon attenuation protein/uracil phosphoribosyltransferase
MIATHIKSQLMSGSEIDRSLVRLAHEIIENTDRTGKLVIVGIHRRGAVLGQRIGEKMRALAARDFPVGTLDITLYRDDLSTLAQDPVLNGTDIPFPLEEKDAIVVDDVLYTGRTSLAALKALLDLGRPRTVRLCVLIDRGHRELPLEARFVGRRVETSAPEIIEVQVASIDGEERVLLAERGPAA